MGFWEKEQEDRFETISANEGKIFIDKKTGIEYALLTGFNAGGVTVLLDRDGKPKINEKYRDL